MPHKTNPISSENISGLSRGLRGYALTAQENIALWHEKRYFSFLCWKGLFYLIPPQY